MPHLPYYCTCINIAFSPFCVNLENYVCVCVCHLCKVLGHTSELLRASQERVRGGESSLEQTQRRLSKMEAAFKATSQEVLKVHSANLCTLVVCQTRVFWKQSVVLQGVVELHLPCV